MNSVTFYKKYLYSDFERYAYTRDEAHKHILKSKLRLTKHDYNFMYNIYGKYLIHDRPLSEKQNALWESIIFKYRKQLRRMEIDYTDVLNLSWKIPCIPNKILVKQNLFDIHLAKNNSVVMSLSFNFNQRLIDNVKKIVHDHKEEWLNRRCCKHQQHKTYYRYNFTWQANSREWNGPFDHHLFRRLYAFCLQYDINIGPNAKYLMDLQQTKFGDAEMWKTQIVLSNHRIYINNINSALHVALQDVDFNDTTCKNIHCIMERYGIVGPNKIGNSITDENSQNNSQRRSQL